MSSVGMDIWTLEVPSLFELYRKSRKMAIAVVVQFE